MEPTRNRHRHKQNPADAGQADLDGANSFPHGQNGPQRWTQVGGESEKPKKVGQLDDISHPAADKPSVPPIMASDRHRGMTGEQEQGDKDG
jgi:hypothetical protein